MRIQKPRIKRAIQEAEKLSSRYSPPLIPALEIAEKNGVDVIFADFGQYNNEIAGYCDFEEKKLYVNDNDTFLNKLHTISHELGHWILHQDIYSKSPNEYPVLRRFYEPDLEDPLELEAESFSAHLLVPEHLLRPVQDAPTAALARVFGVSISIIESRLKE